MNKNNMYINELKKIYKISKEDIREYLRRDIPRGIVRAEIDKNKKLTIVMDPNETSVITDEFLDKFQEAISQEPIVQKYKIMRVRILKEQDRPGEYVLRSRMLNHLLQHYLFSDERVITWEYEIIKFRGITQFITKEWDDIEVVFTGEYNGITVETMVEADMRFRIKHGYEGEIK